jgi:hypothetical protein
MKSPFPGMDPYLERNWRDVHATLIVYIRDQIQQQLGGPLRARVEERLVVESDDPGPRTVYPDARIFESMRSIRQGVALAGSAAVAEPLIVPTPDEEATETFIEIIDRTAGDKLVTVIELLSPANKVGKQSREKYAGKQAEIRHSGVNLVEIDLTRAGRRVLSVHPIPRSHRSTYQACVFRANPSRRQFEIYAIPLRLPIPPIRVPLRQGDKDAVIDLQPLLEQAYRNGAYDDLDDTKPPVPPMTGEDAVWVAELLGKLPRK